MSEFTEVFGEWATATVQVQVLLGAGFNGKEYAPAVDVEGVMYDGKSRLQRGPDGSEVLSQATLTVAPELAHHFHEGDLVTLPNGRTAPVLLVATTDSVLQFTTVGLE